MKANLVKHNLYIMFRFRLENKNLENYYLMSGI